MLFVGTGGLVLFYQYPDAHLVMGVVLMSVLLSFSTFTVNDLVDAEQDRINHPARFLVSNRKARFISVLYYFVLIISYCLLSSVLFNKNSTWVFVSFLLLFVSYSFLKLGAPTLKNAYIALINVGYITYIAQLIDIEFNGAIVFSGLLFVFSRELLTDIPDIDGDDDSIAKRLGPRQALATVNATSFLGALALVPVLLPSKPATFAFAFLIPIFLTARLYLFSNPLRLDLVTRIASTVPYLYCIYVSISS